MTEPTRRYWQSIEQRECDQASLSAAGDEFPGPLVPAPPGVGRRGFLKAAGFGLGGLAAGCSRAPVTRAIPFLVKPEEVTPGRALYYASTCGACPAGCGVLVKVRDGRPIKVEGNPQHPLSRGALCAAGQASVLGLYDSQRHRSPLVNGRASTWEDVDRDVTARLDAIRSGGGAVRLLTGTITSPTLQAQVSRFLTSFPDARHVVYDALSVSAILDAHERTHGRRRLPHYLFDKAAVVVGVDADFLGTWIAPVEFTRGYHDGRSLEGTPPRCSYHVQFEPRLSITGTKADARARILPDAAGAVVGHLAARLAAKAGAAFDAAGLGDPGSESGLLDEVAERLWGARGSSLVVSGSQDTAVQVLVNFVNYLLGNYGRTIDLHRPSRQCQGYDAALAGLLDELKAGRVAALLVAGANPAYDLPLGEEFAALAKKVGLVVSFAGAPDETSMLATHVCPDHHFLEAWGDAEPVADRVSVCQPAIAPLAGTRSVIETLAAWAGDRRPAYDLMREHWQTTLFGRQTAHASFDDFWDAAVHDGIAALDVAPAVAATPPAGPAPGEPDVAAPSFAPGVVAPVPPASPLAADALALVLYPKVGVLDGRHAHNPWLQELPDPISKVTWDNYACLAPSTASRLGLAEGDVVRLETMGEGARRVLDLPVYVQPGQHDQVVAVALGYGREGTQRFTQVGPRWILGEPGVGPNGLVGTRAASLISWRAGTLRYDQQKVTLTPTGGRHELATTQRHHSIIEPRGVSTAGRRDIVRETTVSALAPHAAAGPEHGHENLWPPDHPYTGHRWAMVVDLHACTGCSACVVACQAENNIPVVGRDEVRRQREMHWLRIDRYFTDAGEDVDVVHQPMTCHHCENAPCETVCPVLATVHSSEGLNQQVYNRCVGTRYCANNCPYKVRRFNWFTYARPDDRENLVLNPDVTVRSRGVMEKCSFCVQRIQEAKIEARRQDRPIADGDVRMACEQSCPAGAIVFGDLNDPKSRVAALVADGRHFQVLGDIGIRPRVGYLAVVRNRESAGGDTHHG